MEAYRIFKEEPDDEPSESDGDNEKYVNTNVNPLCFLQEEEESSESGDDDEPARKRSKSGRNSEAVKVQNKLRQARRRLRIQLSKNGALPEQIEMEVQKLEASYKVSPPVPTSTQRPTQRPTHEEIKAKNRMRQAKRRLRIKLRESGASQENVSLKNLSLFQPPFCSEDDDDVNTNVDPLNPLCFLHEEEESSESGDDDEPARKRSKSGRNSEAVKVQNKLRQARRRLRIKLSKNGASPEEVEMEVKKLEASYKASPPVPTSTQRRTHEEKKAKNRMRQAKRRLRIKLRESGASQENIEREIANLFNGDTIEEFAQNQFEVEATTTLTSVLPAHPNFFINTEQENIQQNSEIPFFPTPPAESLEDEEEVDIAELRTQHVYVGRVKLDNLANNPSSKDEYEEQNSSNRTDVAAYLQRKNVVKVESGHDESVPCVIRPVPPVPVLNTFAKQQQHRIQEHREWRRNFMQHYRRKQREKAENEGMTVLEHKIKKEQEEDNRRQKITLTRKTRQKQTQLMESSEDKLQEKRRRKTEYMRNYRKKNRSQPEEEIVSVPNKKSQQEQESEPCSSSKPKSRASYMREWRKLKKQSENSQSSSSSSVCKPIVVRVKKSSSCDEWERGGLSTNKIIAAPLQEEEIEKVKRLQVSIVRLTIHEINLGIRGRLKC